MTPEERQDVRPLRADSEYGKGEHAECTPRSLAQPNGTSIGEEGERWRELCALASKEQDPQRLLALVQEINDLLGQRERLKHQGKPPSDPVSD